MDQYGKGRNPREIADAIKHETDTWGSVDLHRAGDLMAAWIIEDGWCLACGVHGRDSHRLACPVGLWLKARGSIV